jgi:hypothetical protein
VKEHRTPKLRLPERTCCCQHSDAETCYRYRYGLDHWEDQAEDPGECECACHERDEEDDDEH